MDKIKIFHAKKVFKPKDKDATTSHSHIWFSKNGQKYMFKLPASDRSFRYSLLNEVIISKMCQQLNIPCQQANFAQYEFWDTKGIIIKSFLQKGEKEISVDQMQKDYIESYLERILGEDFFDRYIYPALENKGLANLLNKDSKDYASKVIKKYSAKTLRNDTNAKLDLLLHLFYEKGTITDITSKFNPIAIQKIDKNSKTISSLKDSLSKNLTDKDIVKLTQMYAKKHNLGLDIDFEDKICAYALFDYLTIQEDRNTTNISFIQRGDSLTLAPLFDNGMALSFHKKYDKVCVSDEKIWGAGILMTDLTKSKLYDEHSQVYQYKCKIGNFLKNNFDEFGKEFIAQYPECMDFAFLIDKRAYSPEYKQNFIVEYFNDSKTAMQMRLNDLENNKNLDHNSQNNIITDLPIVHDRELQQTR